MKKGAENIDKVFQEQEDDFFLRQEEQKHWSRDLTFWKGVGAIFSGMCIQAALGVEAIWGNIVIYVASKYKYNEPNLSLQFALIVFPCSFAVGSLAMQLGSCLMDHGINPRLHIVVGAILYAGGTYVS